MTTINSVEVDVTPPRDDRSRNSGTFAALGLLVRRRLVRDRWLALSSLVIVALATLLAISGPALVLRTVDDGAADAVNAAGANADITITVPVGNPAGDNVSSVRGAEIADFAAGGEAAIEALPEHTRSIVAGYDAYVLSTQIPIGYIATAEAVATAAKTGAVPVHTNAVGDYLTFGFSPDAAVTLVDGALPKPPPPAEETTGVGAVVPPTQIALSQDVADALGVGIGDWLQVNTPVGESMLLELVGIVKATNPEADVWGNFPEFTTPLQADGGAGPGAVRGTVMVDEAAFENIARSLRTPFQGIVRVHVDPTKLTLSLASSVAHELEELPTNATDTLNPVFGASVHVQTGLDTALEQYPARARAALAQMSIIIAGVVSVAAVVIALMAALLLARRESDISLERARGASVTSVTVRLLTESLIVAILGVIVGVVAASLLTPGASATSPLALVVALVAAASSPIMGARLARSTWTGRREAANRQDRAKVAKAKRARRITFEALTVVVAVAAVVSLRGRGVLQTATEGVDPFLAATPVLLSLAIVVIVVRIYPIPMRLVQFVAKRTRGVAGVLTLAKSRERIPVLPLLALTLSIGIAVAGGVLVSSVQAGQEQASWDRVGADVRIETEVTDQQADALENQGLTVSRGLMKPGATLALGSDYASVYLLAMDENYPKILTAAGVEDVSSWQKILTDADALAPGEPIPALASQDVIDVDVHEDSSIYVGRVYVPIDITGEAVVTPDGWADEPPYLLMPIKQLMDNEFTEPVPLNLAFVNGPNAAQIVAADPTIDPTAVTTRAQWLSAMQDSALIGGVERAIAIAVLAVGILAAVALLVSILRGVRERGRALSMLRTQGMGSGYGWWLALAELGPLTLAAVIGGAIAGYSIMALLGSTLGLKLLSGGITDPPLVPNWTFLAYVGGGILVLLFLAVAAEVLTHRRNKLSEVLRWGESR